MRKMIRWSTPDLTCKIPNISFDYLILTLTGSRHKINKEVEYASVEDNRFTINLTQDETKRFVEGEIVEVQINFMANNGESRIPTKIVELEVGKNLLNEVVR